MQSSASDSVTTSPALDEQGHLDDDRRCSQCDHHLQGLRPDGACPECGLSIALSLQGDALRLADSMWLRRVSIGTWLLFVAYLALVVGFFGTGSAAWEKLLDCVHLTLVAIGAILVTGAQPNRRLDESIWSPRRVARVCLPLLLLVAPITITRSVDTTGAPLTATEIALECVLRTFVLAHFAGTFALLLYLRQLGRRIPSVGLVRFTTVMLVGSAPLMAIVAIMAVATLPRLAAAGAVNFVNPPFALEIVLLLLLRLIPVGLVAGVVLLSLYARAFRRIVRAAAVP